MIPTLDRSEGRRRDEDRLAAALAASGSRFILFDGDRAFLRPDAIEPVTVSGGQLRSWGASTRGAVLLGFDGDIAWFGLDLEAGFGDRSRAEQLARLADGGEFVSLGPIQGPVDREVWGLLSQARSLLAWNRVAARCPACGGPTAAQRGGFQRICLDARCGRTSFPRTDPAVIVRVLHGERCLLARAPRFRPRVRSVIAGFVEPGESLQSAVCREVAEEVGLGVNDVRYLGSQPWPFPTSLMVAFEGHAASERIRVDGNELEDAAWYTRDDVREGIASGRLALPSRKSIARRMIDGWMAGDRHI